MSPTLDEVAQAAAVDFARSTAALCRDHLGGRLLGIYLIGSLAHGIFNRRYSDIDFAIVTESGLDPADIAAIRAAALSLSSTHAPKLSLFWTDRAFAIGRFPPLDRVDYLDFAVTLAEREKVLPIRPTPEEIRSYLAGTPLTNWADNARRLAAMDTLDPKDHKLLIRMHLYPARFIYSWMTGRMASNDAAVAFVREQRPPGIDVGLIDQALALRHAAADPDALFPARSALPTQYEASRRFLAA